MFKKRFALAASMATLAVAGCGSSTSTSASASSATTPTARDVSAASGGRPAMQTVTGTAATKASAAALAKYPGTVKRVTKFGDAYVVDVTTTSGAMKHVAVSTDFVVTGLQQRPAGGPPNGTAPNATTPPKASDSQSSGTAIAST